MYICMYIYISASMEYALHYCSAPLEITQLSNLVIDPVVK